MSSSRRRALAIVLLLLASPACASRTAGTPAAMAAPAPSLAADLDALLGVPPASHALWGVIVRAPGGPALYQRSPSLLLHPASNMKLLTLAVAAERLGWDFRFETAVRATSPVEPDGTLRGDLVVVGSGDPAIARRHAGAATLAGWADQLWAQGVRRVTGRVIGDARAFGGEPFGSGWEWDDLAAGYAAPVSALSYNENTAEIRVSPGPAPGARATLVVVDHAAGVRVRNEVYVAAGASARRIFVRRAPGEAEVTITGEVPAGHEPFSLFVAVPDPPAYFARAFRDALAARGIRVGAARSAATDPPGPYPAGAPVFLRRQSPALRELAPTLMKVSQNLYAELLLRALGAASGDSEGGTAVLAATLADWGAGRGGVVVGDGSGLTRHNLVSAATVDLVLSRMFQSAVHREPWLAAMAVAGVDGTLERRMKGTPAEGRVFAKTGTISYVRALSGYARTLDEEWVQFAILANNVAGEVTTAEVDRVAEQIVNRLVTGRRAAR